MHLNVIGYSSVPFETRVNTVLSWLDKPPETRPQFMALYFNEPDHTAHGAGPNTTAVNEALAMVDSNISLLINGLKERNIYDCVNIIIVSDHGMATLFDDKIFSLYDQILPTSYKTQLEYTTYGIFSQLYVPNSDSSLTNEIYQIAKDNATKLNAPVDVYLRDEAPQEFHVGHYNQDRYGDVFIISHLHSILKLNQGDQKPVTGQHGYDNREPLMRAIFLSHGPAFKSQYKKDSLINIDIYELMCNILKIPSAPNNGSLDRVKDILLSSN
jgi:ectonucleotide pyrophosphatase/phosphodiesterase family protein 1/3